MANVYVNLEDWIDHIRRGLANQEKSPAQVLFQWDNGTDISCWEPEYGGTKLLVELFAREPDKYVELYVGKSDNVEYLLDYEPLVKAELIHYVRQDGPHDALFTRCGGR